MPHIEINGASLHYERQGEGPPILFIHGLGGHADAWANQAARLTGGHTCVRYDRRGYSPSATGSGEVVHAQHSADAEALIEALDLAPCVIVGGSLGGALAIDVACRRPDLVRGAVVCEPPLFSLDADAGQSLMADIGPRIGDAIEANDGPAFIDSFYGALCSGLWERLDEPARDRYRANGGIAMVDLRSPPLGVTDDRLGACDVPVLVVGGDTSHPSLRTVARRLAAACRDARFVEFEACGHVPYVEQPEQFAQAVEVFLAELDARSAAR